MSGRCQPCPENTHWIREIVMKNVIYVIPLVVDNFGEKHRAIGLLQFRITGGKKGNARAAFISCCLAHRMTLSQQLSEPIRYKFYFCGVYPVALLIRILPKYISTITTDNLYLFYSVCSLHVSAPTGHPQMKHNNIICIFMKTIIPQHICYFTIIHLYGVHLLLSIYLLYNHIMIIV
jgi:hypothetical protein